MAIRVDLVARAILVLLEGTGVEPTCRYLTPAERTAVVNLAAQGEAWRCFERLGEGLALVRVLARAGEPAADLEHADLLRRYGRGARKWLSCE